MYRNYYWISVWTGESRINHKSTRAQEEFDKLVMVLIVGSEILILLFPLPHLHLFFPEGKLEKYKDRDRGVEKLIKFGREVLIAYKFEETSTPWDIEFLREYFMDKNTPQVDDNKNEKT